MTLEEILANLPDVAVDPIAVAFQAPEDRNSAFVYVNEAFLDLFGYERDEVLGLDVQVVNHPDNRQDFIANFGARFDAGERSFSAELNCIKKDGSTFWASMSLKMIDDKQSGGKHSVILFRDFSEIKKRELAAEKALAERDRLVESLAETQCRLLSAINAFPDPFAIYDFDERLVLWNDAYWRTMLESPSDLTEGMRFRDVLALAIRHGHHPANDDEIDENWLSSRVKAWREAKEPLTMELPDGRVYRTLRSVSNNGDIVVLRLDVTEIVNQQRELENYARALEKLNREIADQAERDELTGLGNRRHLTLHFEVLRQRRKAEGGEIAALAIDLDRFKQINDTLGHAAGDEVLKSVAKRLKEVVALTDIVARVGGDEFLILRLVEAEDPSFEQLAQNVAKILSAPLKVGDMDLVLGASIGVARTPVSSEEELLTNADIALYKAKSKGRGKVATFDELDLLELLRSKRVSDEILGALENDAFLPFFQPQIEAATGRVVALEALARWKHPTDGFLPPQQFLSVASDLGVLATIDAIITEKAIRFCTSAFGPENAPSLSLNLSEDLFLSEDLKRVLAAGRTYPGELTVELLETILFEEQGEAFQMQLDMLRDAGIGIQIDDFGSGRASIIALEQVAPDRLKIDRRLVRAVADSDRSAKLVKAIVDIAAALGIGVTAEGVETAEQEAKLVELGCDRLQGFLYGEPMPFEQILKSFEFPRCPRVAS